MMRVELRGYNEISAMLAGAPRKIKTVATQWRREVATDQAKYIRDESPERTGDLKKTIKPYSRGNVFGVEFKPQKKYLPFIIKGTRPHIIEPRRAKALHFFIGRKGIFTMRVHHPGTQPNDFIMRGVKKFDSRTRYWLRELNRRIVSALKARG